MYISLHIWSHHYDYSNEDDDIMGEVFFVYILLSFHILIY